ncbi:MAG: DUF1846 domain-containing protein [Clostridia bacterium]|nr:DUF1846 domain-containing protein [Clostridia bacterium]
MKIGFNNELYLKTQSEEISKRIEKFGGKLYLEFGGKLLDDFHAARVLPGFEPDSKLRMLKNLSHISEIIIVINAADIESNKKRGDLDITYDADVLRLMDEYEKLGLFVGSVVISQYAHQSAAKLFKSRLEAMNKKVFLQYPIEGYPFNVKKIVSPEGFGMNEYIETSRPLIVITAPGPGSGKMSCCLSQLYHDNLRGIKAGYAKFETFPIWNIPLKHPVNLAYEAATANLDDVNMIDPYHLEAYGKSAVNYNRDIEVFPVLNAIFEKIEGTSPYKSPTDMGVNMAGNCIFDDEAVCNAAKEEIIRRYFNALCEQAKGNSDGTEASKIEILMNQTGIAVDDRAVTMAALYKSKETGGQPAVAIELEDGRLITGKTSALLGAASAAMLNAVKAIAGIDKDIDLIAPELIAPIQELKTGILSSVNPRLHTDEVLIALSIASISDENAKKAMDTLPKLKGLEAHSTVILSSVDNHTFKKLGINLTSEPRYQSKKLFHK